MAFNLNRAKHPFFQHSDADFIVAESEGLVGGRIAVLHNKHHNQYQNRKAAFFCFFDVIEDIQVARALITTAFDWCRKRGLAEITGPRGLLRFDGTGLLVSGFEHRAAMGMAYNYPYYDKFVTDSGFEKVTDHYSGYILSDFELPPEVYQVAEKVKERKGYSIKTFSNKKDLWAWVNRIGELFNSSFAAGRDFYPITEAELHVIASNLISIADPRLIKLVMKDKKIIGFILSYPDIGEALQKVKGRLYPFGWLTLMRAQKTTRRLNLNGIGLLPEYQGLGGTTVLYTELYKTGKPMGYEYAETIQVDEENFLSKSETEHMKVIFHKTHRSYTRFLQ
jgi:GNAT superfamily N-acetyltransferase